MPDQTFSEELYDDKALKDAVDRMANLIKTHTTKAYVDSAVEEKQNKLTFDSTPTASSTNPVTSGGVKTALDAKQDALIFDNEPTAESTKPVTSGGVYEAVSELKENFDLINDGKNTAHLSWEHGTISQTDGTNVDPATTTRARIIGYLSTNCVVKVNHSNVAWGTYIYYYNKYRRFQMRTEQIQSAEITPNKNYPFFRIAILRRLSTTGDVDLAKATNDYTIIDSLDFAQNTDEKINELKNGYESLYIGELENRHLTANGNVDDEYSNYRLSSKNIVALPMGTDRKLIVHISPDYLVAIRTGKSSTNLNNNLYWYANGDVITIPDGDNYYALSFCVNDGVGYASYTTTEITQSDINKMSVSLLFVSHNKTDDTEAEKVFNASRLLFSTTNPNSISIMPVIAHTSDCHGDYARVKNFLDFSDRVGVDVAAITGDMVSFKPSQGLAWFKELINSTRKTIPVVCVGNHDAFDSAMDDSGLYDFVFSGITTKIGNTTGKTWYYKDIAEKKLRVISINLYQYGGTTRNYSHFTDEQLSWLCSALNSTPSDYGVVMLYHSPQINVDTAVDPNYNKFFQATRKYSNIYSEVIGSPINDIIDAFIQKTTISKSYTQTGTPSSITVSADFSALNTGVEFIAHLTGHFHQDSVCYVPSTAEKQLMLNVVCTNALYGGSAYPYLCDVSDLPRSKEDITQNSFNLYVIDRTNGLVKITRIGSNTTYDMKKRDYMEIPYK